MSGKRLRAALLAAALLAAVPVLLGLSGPGGGWARRAEAAAPAWAAAVPALQVVGAPVPFSKNAPWDGEKGEGVQPAELAGDCLFSVRALTAALEQGDGLRRALAAGALIAVFDAGGIDRSFEAALGLPIQFPSPPADRDGGESVVVGRLYALDGSGAPVAGEVELPARLDTWARYRWFLACAGEFARAREASVSDGEGRLGTAQKFAVGWDGRPALSLSYGVYAREQLGGEDYYLVRGELTAQAGRGAAVRSLTADLAAVGEEGQPWLYRTRPNSTGQAALTWAPGSGDGAEERGEYRVEKRVGRTVSWTVTAAGAELSSLRFAPEGTVIVPSGAAFSISARHTVTADAPAGAGLTTGFFFTCRPSEKGVEPA